MKTETRNLPDYLACYLINNDASGLNESELSEINEYLKAEGLPMPVSCSEESYFSRTNDLNNTGGNVLEYTFLIQQ